MDKSNNVLSIIYVSTLCSPKTFHKLFNLGTKHKPGQQVQNYHRLMAEGLAAHKNVRVFPVGAPPVSRRITGRLFFSNASEIDGSITYPKSRVVNIPILRNLITFCMTFTQVLLRAARNKKSVVVCDVLNITMTLAVFFAVKLTGKKIIGIVTDLPGYLSSKGPWAAFCQFLMCRMSAYLFLTGQMSAVVNKKNRPYVIIEGQVDSKAPNRANDIKTNSAQRVCMYTGNLNKDRGVDMLAEAFISANIPNTELRFYGSGDYEEELKQISRHHKNIRFGGMIPYSQLVNEQTEATLLLNPLPSGQLFTSYMFPSKIMEYITSGTPLLTTRLPSIPDEYIPHMYVFEDETVEGYAKTLREVLSLSAEELHEKGLQAKIFAMEQKNNIVQAGKLLRMIREELPGS
jgi:glycosyltransferase involved in cell wall biosynthesis